MKYYIFKNQHDKVDGEYLNGITPDKPIVIVDGKEEIDPRYIEVEMDEADDHFINQINYKVKNNKIERMTQAELDVVYPNLNKPPEPTLEETQTEFNIDIDYRVACLELGIA